MTPDDDTKTERLATRSTRVEILKYSIAKYFQTFHIHFQVMVVEANPVESFTPGVEIAVVRDMEGGLLLVCSASGK